MSYNDRSYNDHLHIQFYSGGMPPECLYSKLGHLFDLFALCRYVHITHYLYTTHIRVCCVRGSRVFVCMYVCLCYRLQRNEDTLGQSQTCVQELTTELRNRCLELRDLRQKDHQQEKLQQVRERPGSGFDSAKDAVDGEVVVKCANGKLS